MSRPATNGPTRVLYIGGWGRSGSTLLDMMLGQLPGFFSAGEVREIWNSGCAEDRPCGCGAAFSSCPFWSQVGDEAFGGWARLDLDDVLRLRYTFDRQWCVPLLSRRAGNGSLGRKVRRYAGVLDRLYQGIRAVSGADVIIDSSNLPSHALILRQLDEVDLRLVHLVRDSRGAAYSWSKHVAKPSGLDVENWLPRYGAVPSALRWSGYNATTQALQLLGVPYLRERYEDLVSDPEAALARIVHHAGSGGRGGFAHVTPGGVDLPPNHMVEGNPVRFRRGKLGLQADEQWRHALRSRDRRIVTAMSMPLLALYGYPVRVSRNGRPAARERTNSDVTRSS